MHWMQLFQWQEFKHMWQYIIYYFALAAIIFCIMYLIISEIKKQYDE
jgi:hypothetical protein